MGLVFVSRSMILGSIAVKFLWGGESCHPIVKGVVAPRPGPHSCCMVCLYATYAIVWCHPCIAVIPTDVSGYYITFHFPCRILLGVISMYQMVGMNGNWCSKVDNWHIQPLGGSYTLHLHH